MLSTTEIFYTIILASVFFVLLIAIIVIAMWRYYSRKRAHEVALLQFDQTLLQTRLEIQEQTFATISQEIHDNVGQLLSLAKLNLNTVNFGKEDQAKEKLGDANSLISQSIQSLRDLAKTLHADMITQWGLLHALEMEIRMIEKIGVIQPVFRVFGNPVILDENKSLIIFRIVQEALHNVIKHSSATIVEMEVQFLPAQISLTIKDNGKGLNASNSRQEGSGLRNMKDRARVIGAVLEIKTNEPSGTAVILTIPHT